MDETSLRSTVPNSEAERASTYLLRRNLAISRRSLLPLIPAASFLALVLIGALWSGDASAQNLPRRLQPPVGFGGSWDYPLGTDSLGRDVLTRVLAATGLSLQIGLVVASLSAMIGIVPGLVAGITGGWFDLIVTGLVELVLAIPIIVIGLVMAATIGQGITNVVLLLALTGWIAYARVVRLQARTIVRSDFVLASVALGAKRWRVARSHVLPNALPQMVALFCQQIAAVMIWEASLTYLGIGLPIERVSLGGMIREGQQQVFAAPWIGIVPGMAIALAVVSFNLLADEIQVWIDPVKKHGRNASR